MTNWLSIANDDTWPLMNEKRLWSVSKRHWPIMATVERYDRVIVGIIGVELLGSFKVAGKPYTDQQVLFTGGRYPHRVKIEPRVIPDRTKRWSDEIIQHLEIMQDRKNWEVQVLGAEMIPLSDADFFYLERFLQKRERDRDQTGPNRKA